MDRQGQIKEAVRLNIIDDRDREELVAFHFAQQYAEIHYGGQQDRPHFYVVGRDNPWDFEYVMHDGSTFFLEICRIADKDLLKAIRIENDCSKILAQRAAQGFEILKVEKHFPGTIPPTLLKKIKTKADRKATYRLENLPAHPRTFVRPPMLPRLELKEEIFKAIKKKAAKPHRYKDRTILLLDNLTTHHAPTEFFAAIKKLDTFIYDTPFCSIWLYTGYYSDEHGYDCEFSILPVKPSEKEARALARW